MKNIKLKSYIAGAITFIVIFASTGVASAVELDISTQSKTSVQAVSSNGSGIVTDCTSATINGFLGLNGSSSASVWFEWGPTQSLGRVTPRQTFTTDSNFSQIITGLIEGTTYYYRAVGENDSGIEYGEIRSFTVNCPVANPTVDLTADSYSLNYNGATTLRWTSTNAATCTASGGTNGWSGNRSTTGSFPTGNLTNTISYSITCSNSRGSASDSVTINVGGGNQNQPTVDIRADDTRIDYDDSTIIRWDSNNADTCTGSGGRNGWSGNKSFSGSFDTGDLTNDVTYTITCTNSFGSANDSVTVRVDDEEEDRPTVNIRANPSSVQYNGTSTVTWDSDNADTCRANGGTNGWSGSKNTNGSFYTGSLTYTTTFNITCENDSGSASDSVTIYVNPTQPPVNNQPTVVIYADSTNIAYNSATNIRWSSTNATYCNASGGSIGWAGVKSIGPASFYTGSLTGTRTYSITCSNDVGSSTDSVTVNVRGQVLGTTTVRTQPTSLVLITSSVDRNRPIVPTLDNTNPCPGDEINYSINYQNIGTGSIRNLILRVDLPYEVDYMFSTPNNPMRSGQTLIFNLGTLRANGEGNVTIRVRVRDNVPAGAPLNFPATLSYTDPTGYPQSVNANVSANVCGGAMLNTNSSLDANIFGAGFLPTSIFGWLLLLILILILILLARYLFGQTFQIQRRTVTTYDPLGKTTTTMHH